MTYTLPEPLPDTAIALRVEAEDWRAAVRSVGSALEASGCTDASYSERMIALVEEYGPYIVIAPGLAMAHARPGPDVHASGLAVVTLATPMPFGHAHNDPVSVVIGLAATEADSHVASVAALANVFNDESMVPALAAARDAVEVRQLLSGGASAHDAETDADGSDAAPRSDLS
ncbi:PTS sugar transporter subunit IIA [Herbiconiux sp. CPCC 203407]|uniref:Ascorbate-specific PTS system EIIA component n=1 Tax=Herbiconiux oxytropis TaxID=2970915 RepID=A0AA42BTU6_9MICO|nr:PTS sugar transporter subunit IIA [Herbiconiux oxytropis]MCS5721973.1 PTS sugar transporter subunit IIA [Herbiconiux oxytropis]MCS5725556.1 PTS sugar transporter subunit IIA [Herbiconiux oxytropis]